MTLLPTAPPVLTAGSITAARAAIEAIAHRTVPALADFCVVHVRHRHALRAVAGAHTTAAGERDVRALMDARIDLDDSQSTAAYVVRTGRPVLRSTVEPDRRPGRRDRIATLVERLAPRSVLVMPIAVGPTVVGTLSLCYAHSGRSYASRHLPRARRLASRIAAALLPGGRPDMPVGLRSAARHAGQGTIIRRRLAARS